MKNCRRKIKRSDSQTSIYHPYPSGNRHQDHRERNNLCYEKRCHRQMLRMRRDEKKEIIEKAERRKEKDEVHR